MNWTFGFRSILSFDHFIYAHLLKSGWNRWTISVGFFAEKHPEIHGAMRKPSGNNKHLRDMNRPKKPLVQIPESWILKSLLLITHHKKDPTFFRSKILFGSWTLPDSLVDSMSHGFLWDSFHLGWRFPIVKNLSDFPWVICWVASLSFFKTWLGKQQTMP